MMLCVVPPWNAPTVTTAGWSGLISRLTTVCAWDTKEAAATIGSTAASGCAAWPDLPRTTRSKRSAAASVAPRA